ncbi:MAG: hypothetical protein AB1726_07175 [Planctomycetota bacterium]
MKAGKERGRIGPAVASVLALIAACALATAVRIEVAFSDPNCDWKDPAGMLKSDPALLYYITERIVEAGGRPPADFRADPRIQHPVLTDIPGEFTVGQEFLAAWAFLACGGGMALHAFCVVLFSAIASLAAAGAWGLAREVTGSRAWAAVALALFCLLPANYRTIGFILIREDLSFPLFAVHLWLLARAARVPTPRAFLLAGIPLAAALATWHAMSFVVLLEVGCALLWFLRGGGGPFRVPGAAALLVAPIAAAVLVPAMSRAGLLLSAPMVLALALLAAGMVHRRGGRRGGALLAAAAVAAGGVALSRWGGSAAYGHVWDVLAAKVVHLGRLPADPDALSFDARLLWQGPFETLRRPGAWRLFGWGLLLAAAAIPRTAQVWWRGERPGEAGLYALLAASLVAAWMIERTSILAGLLIPVAGVAVLSRLARRWVAVGLAGAFLLLQGGAFPAVLTGHPLLWYVPRWRQAEIAALVEWVGENVPAEEAIAGDFMNSTAILAHTRRPIVLQPKYETESSRRRAQAFYETFFQGTPAQMRRLVRDGFQARYLLVDRYALGKIARTLGGLPDDDSPPPPGTAAAVFLSQDGGALAGEPGFELVYRSPPEIRQTGGAPTDLFRLYRLSD